MSFIFAVALNSTRNSSNHIQNGISFYISRYRAILVFGGTQVDENARVDENRGKYILRHLFIHAPHEKSVSVCSHFETEPHLWSSISGSSTYHRTTVCTGTLSPYGYQRTTASCWAAYSSISSWCRSVWNEDNTIFGCKESCPIATIPG